MDDSMSIMLMLHHYDDNYDVMIYIYTIAMTMCWQVGLKGYTGNNNVIPVVIHV